MYALFFMPRSGTPPQPNYERRDFMQDEVNEKVVSLAIKTSKADRRSAAKGYESPACQRQRAANQSPAWENHYAAAYEAGRKGFQH